MKTIIGQQGEVRIIRIDSVPVGMATRAVDRVSMGAIISHSESGNHHVLTGDQNVMERTDNVPTGMRILYAILTEPQSLVQDAAVPHGQFDLAPGVYEFRCSREYDPFAEQIRRVAD